MPPNKVADWFFKKTAPIKCDAGSVNSTICDAGKSGEWIGGVYNRRLSPLVIAMPEAFVESLDNEGRGFARVDGKAIFIEGALSGEHVEYASYQCKSRYEQAHAIRILRSSSQRVTPHCPHFGTCGGCSMQHLDASAQIAAKHRVLEDALWHLAKLKPDVVYPPITGSPWGYRNRARLSVRYVSKTEGTRVGFREKRSSHVTEMNSCAVLPPSISNILPGLKVLLEGMSAPESIPQIEVAIGDAQCVLVLRHLEPLTAQDMQRLKAFADVNGIVWYLQLGGPGSVRLFYPPDTPPLAYSLPDFGLNLRFSPTEFTQVNHGVNRVLVRRVMALLNPAAGEFIADMFCGLGNFTLPIASSGAAVVGVEGSKDLVDRARSNAVLNGLDGHCQFKLGNLFEATQESLAGMGHFDKMLIDPPRDGAVALVNAIGERGPQRIVYVSCKPSTLARDAAILVRHKGYQLRGAGIANMFPHTSHLESIALFERP